MAQTSNTVTQPNVKIVNWSSKDCSECDSFTADGITYKVFETPEIYLSFTMTKGEDNYVADVFFLNKSDRRIEFKPEQSVIAVWEKNADLENKKPPKEYFAIPPEKIVKKLETRMAWANALLGVSGAMQTKTTTTQTTENGTATVYGNGTTTNGTYNGTSTSTTTTPDRDAQQRGARQQQQNSATTTSKTSAIIDSALRANTVFPKQQILGRIYFPKKKFEFLYLGIRIEDSLYTIAFSNK